MNDVKILYILLWSVQLLREIFCLHCYNCESFSGKSNQICTNLYFKKTSYLEKERLSRLCPANKTHMCIKKTKINNESEIITRGCASNVHNGQELREGCMFYSDLKDKINICWCSQNECNSSILRKPILSFLMFQIYNSYCSFRTSDNL